MAFKPLSRDKLKTILKTQDAIVLFEDMMTQVGEEIPVAMEQLVRKDTLTNRGDIFVRDASDVTRLALGAIGRVLQSDGTDALWQQLTSASISDFAERAQDEVGGILANTSTVTLAYADGVPSISASIPSDAISNPLLADMAQDTIKGRASGAGTGDPTDLSAAQVAAIVSTAVASALNITDPTSYTPTLTNVANLSASTANLSWYVRVRGMVFVMGFAGVDPTAAGNTELGISLPIASNFGANTDLIGVAAALAVAGQSAGILADVANDRARLIWNTVDTANNNMFYLFMYRVI